jgi:hypothetical protein
MMMGFKRRTASFSEADTKVPCVEKEVQNREGETSQRHHNMQTLLTCRREYFSA